MNPTKHRGWTQALQKGKQFQLHQWHRSRFLDHIYHRYTCATKSWTYRINLPQRRTKKKWFDILLLFNLELRLGVCCICCGCEGSTPTTNDISFGDTSKSVCACVLHVIATVKDEWKIKWHYPKREVTRC